MSRHLQSIKRFGFKAHEKILCSLHKNYVSITSRVMQASYL